jgi:hypothetical protein
VQNWSMCVYMDFNVIYGSPITEWYMNGGARFHTSNILMGMVVRLFIKKFYVGYSKTTCAVNHSIKFLW